MKLNMGCGMNKLPGYTNVDMFAECAPDFLHDLEQTPWPWANDSVTEVVFSHSLEHIGGDSRVFLAMMQELYRVCQNGAAIRIAVPHPRHDHFIGDPTHVRIITPLVLQLFSKRKNLAWKAAGAANSPLALYLGVDFEVEEVNYLLDEPYSTLHREGKLDDDGVNAALREKNNVASEIRILLRVVKPEAEATAENQVDDDQRSLVSDAEQQATEDVESQTPANLALELGHEASGEDGICRMTMTRAGCAPERAEFHVSLNEFTQKVLYQQFGEGVLYEYETSMLAIGALRPGDLAIDVGAHVGYFTFLFRLLVGATGKVFAFEPMPDTYRRLVENVRRNGFDNVLPLSLALAERSGRARFNISARNEGESSLIYALPGDSCEVEVTSLDEHFSEPFLARPRLLKIDAEGAEMLILQGAQQWFAREAPEMVICEINRGALDQAGTHEDEIREFFAARNYRCAVVNLYGMDMGASQCGGKFYRYLEAGEPAAPDSPYVFNLMFVHRDSDLYPEPFL
ncbi:MAG: FkbM family methyltransferase [Dokdonella sp.]|nr:MAG: FkbM family methyltransferase [Dokdonella sp.]